MGESKGFDVTGLYVWPSSYVLARWLVTRAAAAPSTLEHKVVFDLGSGCGLAGLTAALVGNAAEVHLSDLVPNVLSNLRHNVMLNQERASVQWRAPSVELIDWQDSTTWPQSGSADLVLGADLLYDDGVADLLGNVLAHMLKEGGEFVHVRPERGRTGASELTAALAAWGRACRGATGAALTACAKQSERRPTSFHVARFQ